MLYLKERAEIRILANIADAQGLGRARDLLRMAENEFYEADKRRSELEATLSGVGGTEWEVEPLNQVKQTEAVFDQLDFPLV